MVQHYTEMRKEAMGAGGGGHRRLGPLVSRQGQQGLTLNALCPWNGPEATLLPWHGIMFFIVCMLFYSASHLFCLSIAFTFV